ncbi:MAG: glycoside hydrolase family 30 beta sandwich domain-containing protein [bacterium]|nr:glycoside hydrolase family 30 beta sandwich domain-containing protein [bacterium]
MQMNLTTTTFTENQKKVETVTLPFHPDQDEERDIINLYPQMSYQEFLGFGGAFTESAGYVYAGMDQESRELMLHDYFDEHEMHYILGRIHLDSCDFSCGHYEAMSDPKDVLMESFSIDHMEQYVFPLLDDAQKICGRPIEIMVSPWSPPSFMKTNSERDHGGKLKPEYHTFWAEYICRYITLLRRRGLHVNRMTLQNEPNASQPWDSCRYTAEEEKVFLRDFLYPAFIKYSLEDIEIFIWDHNKERAFERAETIIDAETDHMVKGIAFHWYSGDHFEALSMIREKYPDKILAMSEACIEYYKYDKDDYLRNAQRYAHDMIGNMNHGMQLFYDWNLVLDEKGGPNHAGNLCDAPYLYDAKQNQLIERNTLAYIRHFSHYIQPGARRIGWTKYTADMELTAFQNPDGTLIVVLLNQEQTEKQIRLRLNGMLADIKAAPQSIATGVILY